MKEILKTYLQPAFLICVTILLVSAAGMSTAVKSFGMYLKKEPLPLKNPLDLLDENGLGTYKVIAKQKIENKDVLQSLGTEDYIEWVLDDPQVSGDSSVRRCVLFITYYPLPDQVPHVPEECYTGGGYQRLSSETLTVRLDGTGIRDSGENRSRAEVPVKYLVFASASSEQLLSDVKFSVLYLFSVNGQYVSSREDTRLALSKNIFGKYSYFSKIEWKFYGVKFGDRIFPSREEAAEASSKLLTVILPILEKKHWPSTGEGGEGRAKAVISGRKN